MYKNNKYWWKKDRLVIPRGLSWSKIGNFEKGDNGTLFAEWSNPILSMAPTSNELLQPWFILSVDYSRTSLVDGEHNVSITTTPQVVQHVGSYDVEHEPSLIGHDVEHEREIVLQGEPVVGYPDFALKQQSESVLMFIREELVVEHHAIYKNDSLSEDLVAKHKEFVHKENESGDGKMAESAISDVCISEVYGAKSVSNEFVLQQL
ncbi:hypothetical protein Tco_1454353 [Tanacetum coccineum]